MSLCFIVFNCSIYVVIFSIFLGADVSALVPFCPAQFSVTHCLHLYDYFELISDDNDDDDDDDRHQEVLTAKTSSNF